MKPLNINRESCSPVSSNCVIWNGPDIEFLGLCKGATITEVTYQIATELSNFLDSIKVENFDITCLNSTSCPPETFAELIKLIISYICNIEAQNGADGTNGNYTEVEAFAPGENGCVNGGIAIRTFDGATETQISEYFICNPEDGAEGDQGPQGVRGDYVQVASSSGCPDGGYDIILYSGADDTVISTSTICNGVQGPQGQDIDHVSFTVSTGTPDYVFAQPGETDTYTVWGDAGETINLGSFNVYNGADCDCSGVGLVWEDLTPFLDADWVNLGAATPKYAVDTVNNLLYLSGNISNTTTAATDDLCFTITGLPGTPASSNTICYDDENNVVVGVNQLSTPNTLRFQYLGADTHARLTLDSVPVIRLF